MQGSILFTLGYKLTFQVTYCLTFDVLVSYIASGITKDKQFAILYYCYLNLRNISAFQYRWVVEPGIGRC